MTAPQAWRAPRRQTPIDSSIVLPGSKSLTNRALVLAALAEGPSVLTGALDARDTRLMADALSALGASIHCEANRWTINPSAFAAGGDIVVDCGLAGTVMRFVPPVAALSNADVTFDGDPHARHRPMSTIITALRALGADIDDGSRGALPFTLRGSGSLAGGAVEIDASSSSQFVSALLLAGARYEAGIDIWHTGDALPSMPHIAMTVSQLRARGVTVDDSRPNRWIVDHGPIKAVDQKIEPDLSNAGPFIAAALVTGGTVAIANWPAVTDQAGAQWERIARTFGANASPRGTDMVFSTGASLHGVELDLHDVGELTPVIAAVAAFADSPSHLGGIAHLRGHETDRLTALATQINALGGQVTESKDGLTITPAPLHGGMFDTYEDHRMAHAGAVLGLRIDDLAVENIDTTAKTFPGFASVWENFTA